MLVAGAEVPFDNSITGYLTVYQDQLEKYIAAFRPQRKFTMFFL